MNNDVTAPVVVIVYCLFWLAIGIVLLKLVLDLNLVLATLLMIVFLPVYALSII